MPFKDFSHVRDWVFDLDHTLYPASSQLFSQLGVKMEAFLMRKLRLNQPEAAKLRYSYWQNHGTTLAGLMHHHGTDPLEYLDEVQQIDFSVLTPNPALRDAISALPGRKIVFTNGSQSYAKKATEALGLLDVFESHYGIDDANFICKPAPQAFETIFGKAQLNHAKAAMFEDDPRSLAIPYALGLKTVLVGCKKPAPHIHYHTENLTAFLQQLKEAPDANLM
ncbi:MAG TPA: pyrimidine 5'-nucleotidase [Rhodobacteraceae bacterium]|nr:pyrimidine 5'-nucleotidase [Paracoccaceae bacterium]